MVGVFLDDGLQPPAVEKFVFTFTQVQNNLGAALVALDGFQFVTGFPGGLPVHAFLRFGVRATAVQFHFLGDNEAGIKTDAELSYQVCILCLVSGQ